MKYEITKQEAIIIDHLANGHDRPSLARKIKVTKHTLTSKIWPIHTKLDVTNMTHAVHVLHEEGVYHECVSEQLGEEVEA